MWDVVFSGSYNIIKLLILSSSLIMKQCLNKIALVCRSMARNNNFPLAVILEKEKLHESWTNFVDWYRNVRIVLKGAKKDYVLVTHFRIMQLKMCLMSFSLVVMTTSLSSVPFLQLWNQNFKRGLKTGVHLKPSMSWKVCFSNKLELRDMRSHKHCLTARWQKEARLVPM